MIILFILAFIGAIGMLYLYFVQKMEVGLYIGILLLVSIVVTYYTTYLKKKSGNKNSQTK